VSCAPDIATVSAGTQRRSSSHSAVALRGSAGTRGASGVLLRDVRGIRSLPHLSRPWEGGLGEAGAAMTRRELPFVAGRLLGLSLREMENLSAFALEAGSGERLVIGQFVVVVRASAESTGGAYALLEEPPPMVDTPLHVHEREHELFYVLEGEHVYRVGDEEYQVGPGGLVFAPRGVPHSQRRVVPGEGRQLVLVAPGGFEGFFRELAAAHAAGVLGPDAYTAAARRYAVTWLN
jgi:mannose-6-phosphate isomerase-like protein (cupin superfamily)